MNLLVPVMAYSEVLDAKHSSEQMAVFWKFLAKSNVVVADTTQTIAEKAGEIRSRGLLATPQLSIKTPDATFLATAIVYKATVFHTTETTKLPGLNGSPIVAGLRISAPCPWDGTRSILNPLPT